MVAPLAISVYFGPVSPETQNGRILLTALVRRAGAVVRHSRRRIGGGVPAPPPYLNNPYAIFKKSELNRVANGDGLNSFRRGCRAYCGQQLVAACRVGLYDIREALRILRRKGGCADGDILRRRVSRGHG